MEHLHIEGCPFVYVMLQPLCMMAVFSEFMEEIVEVFMDDFSVYGKTFCRLFSKFG
jgi:hypothetical protein